ncbi:MAG: urea ABC transporter permease subunit UrtB, partial [Clostridium butyricum]
MENFLMQLFNGLSISSILLLASLGLAITFGLMGIINMAHGEFIMIGAYTTYVVQNIFREYLPSSMFSSYFLVSLLASFVVAGLIGLFLERLIIKHLYGRVLDSLLVTWGVSLVLQQLARSIFGTSNVSVDCPQFLNNNFVLSNGFSLSYKRIFILILSIVCVVLIAYLMYKTKQGRNVRAVMQNRSMAASLGVNTSLIDAGTFAIGSGFAGIAGAAITL